MSDLIASIILSIFCLFVPQTLYVILVWVLLRLTDIIILLKSIDKNTEDILDVINENNRL